MEKVRLGRSLGIDSALIQTCLPLFFLYQYPQLMFVYREALLADYFDNACGGEILVVCADLRHMCSGCSSLLGQGSSQEGPVDGKMCQGHYHDL